MSEKTISVLNRFIKGFLSGAVTSMGLVTLAMPTVWSDVWQILNNLGLAAIFGGLNGLLLALQKYVSWKE